MNDLISRQAVTKFLNDWLSCLFENCHKQSASDLKMIIKDFKNLPSAQPEREKGKWTIKNGELAIWDVCSECGRMVMHKAPFYNFCPHCGARMDGEEDG